MKLSIVKTTFSYIGEFENYLINYNGAIRRFLSGWEVQTTQAKANDGREYSELLFSNRNLQLRILANRIDYTIKTTLQDKTYNVYTTYTEASNFLKRLDNYTARINAQRIACVVDAWIDNTDNEALIFMAKNMKLLSKFGKSNELQFRINVPTKSFEPLNNVINLEMGIAKNNQTNVETKVLLVNFDVNTLAANKTARFQALTSDKEFTKICDAVYHDIEVIKDF